MFDKNEISSMKVERLYREVRDIDNSIKDLKKKIDYHL